MKLVIGILIGISLAIFLIFGSYFIWILKWVILGALCLLAAAALSAIKVSK